MSTSLPGMHNLARQLLSRDLGSDDPPLVADHAVQACERLRIPLTKLAGTTGFASLMTRALTLAQRQAPAMRRFRVAAGGSLERTGVHDEHPDALHAREESVLLLAEVLRLLVALIGDRLTLTLVRGAWPKEFTTAGTLVDSTSKSEENR